MFNEYPDLMNSNEVMEILGIGKNFFYKLLSSGQLKAFRVGRTWRIPKCSVEEYIYQSVRDEYCRKKF